MPYVIEASVRQAGGAAPVRVGTYTLEDARATIGRGASCGVPLDDKKKYVSREHAVLDFADGVCAVTVLSKVNPVIVNGARVNPGTSAPVKSGDVLDIGEFRLKLVEVSPLDAQAPAELEAPIDITSSFEAPAVAPAAAPKPAPTPAPADDAIFAEPTFVGERPKDLALRAAQEAPPDSVPAPAPADEAIFAEPTFVGQRPDGFGEPAPVDAPAKAGAADDAIFAEPTYVGDAPEDLAGLALGGAAPEKPSDGAATLAARLKELQSLKKRRDAPAAEDASAEAETALRRPSAPAPGPSEEATTLRARSPMPAAAVDADRSEEETMVRGRPGAPPATASPATPARRAGSATGPLAAFLEGAGLSHLDVPEAEQEAFLRECGSIVRASVDGLVGLLLARSEMKKEMRTEERTMVASRNNNPLKLIADPQEAIAFLFEPGKRATAGFLPPVKAVEDACDDLRAHEIALMAGLRSALLGALKRFDPVLLEKIAEKQKGSFNLNKKVKLWDTFVEYQKKLTLDAEDDFLKAFGREFLGTYQAQVNKLRK